MDFRPLLCPVFCCCCYCCDFFLCWRINTIEPREKTGHGKTGNFHGNDNEKKQHYIHWEIQRSLVKILLFLSVGKLVMLSLLTNILCLPIVEI